MKRLKKQVRYSKIIVALVIVLNAVFAAAAMAAFVIVKSEPVALITAWFAFTTGELWMLATLRGKEIKNESKANESEWLENDERSD